MASKENLHIPIGNDDHDDDYGQLSESKPTLVFERTLPNLDKDQVNLVVVSQLPSTIIQTNPDLENNTTDHQYCIFGSDDHLQALKRKLENASAEADDLKKRIQFLEHSKTQSDPNATHSPTTNIQASSSINILLEKGSSFPAEIQELHATSHNFGKLENFRIIEHKIHGKKWYHSILALPRIRQYFVKGIFHREKEERRTSWDELFFDLIFVTSISKISSHLHDVPNGTGLLEYIVMFFPIWSVWYNSVIFINRYFIDPISMKLHLIIHGVLALTMGINAETVFPKTVGLDKNYLEDDNVVKSTAKIFIAAFLISRIITFSAWCLLLIRNAKFRKNIWYWNLLQNLSSIPYIISLFVNDNMGVIRILWMAGIVVDLIFYIVVANISRWIKFNYRVGVNIEHLTERLGLFTVIVSGEVVVHLKPYEKTNSLDLSYLVCFLGFLTVCSINWIYFDVEASKQSLHALRRSPFTGIIWITTHIPFILSIAISAIGTSFALECIAHDDHYSSFKRGLYLIPLALILICMAVIGLCHRSIDNNQNRVNKRIRMASRLCVAMVFIVVQIVMDVMHYDSPFVVMVIVATLFVYQAIFEEIGKYKIEGKNQE